MVICRWSSSCVSLDFYIYPSMNIYISVYSSPSAAHKSFCSDKFFKSSIIRCEIPVNTWTVEIDKFLWLWYFGGDCRTDLLLLVPGSENVCRVGLYVWEIGVCRSKWFAEAGNFLRWYTYFHASYVMSFNMVTEQEVIQICDFSVFRDRNDNESYHEVRKVVVK